MKLSARNQIPGKIVKVEKGQTIVIHAAAGGVGSIASQWAHALGATVIGTVGPYPGTPLFGSSMNRTASEALATPPLPNRRLVTWVFKNTVMFACGIWAPRARLVPPWH